jgi:hypothetical protein
VQPTLDSDKRFEVCDKYLQVFCWPAWPLDNNEDRFQGMTGLRLVLTICADISRQFSNLLGTVYCQGNLLFSPDGEHLYSPVGNRVTVFDLVK